MKSRRLMLAAVLAALVAAMGAPPASAAENTNDRETLAGSKPSWTAAVPKTADLPAGQRVTAQVWLAPRNQAALDALATAVSQRGGAQFHQYLSAAQYDAMFAPTADQLSAVRGWLTGSGLNVDTVGPSNSYLAVSGSAAAVGAAFRTQLATFNVQGKTEQANFTEVSVPKGLASTVSAVTGLTTFGHRLTQADLGAPGGFRNAQPCSSYYGEKMATDQPQFQGQTLPYAVCGYVPSQFRSAYGVPDNGRPGQGATVAITDAFDSPRLLSDSNTYASNHGDKPFTPNQFQDRSIDCSLSGTGETCAQLAHDCGGNGWYGEQNLDVQAVHGMAPGAEVLYYGAASCYDNDLLAALQHVVSDNKASIVTNSWGEPTFVVIGGVLYITIDQPLITAYENVFKRGALQGIGFYFSSGDNGDELQNWGFKHPDWPTGDPWVTSVGGTALAINQAGGRQFETGWGTSQWRLNTAGTAWTRNVAPFQYGAGGGFSQIFDQPLYQQGVVLHNPTGGRAVPDVAMDADPTTGMRIGITQTFNDVGVAYGEYRIGGTSLASPLFAGFQAVAEGHLRIGFANPVIYGLYRAAPELFYDVTPQGDKGNIRSDFKNGENAAGGLRDSVRTFDQDSSLTTGPGWDDVTGVGTPAGGYLREMDSIAKEGGH